MVKFKKVSADEAQAKRKDHTKAAAAGLSVVKGFRAPPSWDEVKRSARFCVSSESVDRYGDIVVQAGLDATSFMDNPVALLFHNSRSWPCGNWSDVTKLLNGRPKRTEATLNFLPAGTDPDADRAAAHVAAGSMRTVSIGFIPDWENVEFILDDEGDWEGGFRYNASELIEISVVPIPANPDALVKDAGGDMKLARDLIEEILDTWTKTPEGLLIPMDEYRAKHLDLVGERSTVLVPTFTFASADPTQRDATLASLQAGISSAFGREIPVDVLLAAIEKDAEAAPCDPEMKADPEMDPEMKDDEDPDEEPGDPDIEPVEADKDAEAAEAAAKEAAAVLERAETEAAAAAAAPTNRSVQVIEIDLTEATEKVSAFEKLVDAVGAKLAKLFGAAKTKEAEPEPIIAPVPDEAEMAAALERAKTIQARLIGKGYVEPR